MKPRFKQHICKSESNCKICRDYINKLDDHRQSIVNRFWSKVNKTNFCWVWIGLKDQYGYGSFTLNGSKCGSHRFAYESLVNKIPKNKELDHLCRNRACVNPDHLEIVTHKENCKRGDHKTNHYQSKKTHCPKGHELSGDNLLPYQLKIGGRSCRLCANERQLRYYYKQVKNQNNGGDKKSKELLRLGVTSHSNNTKRGKRKFDVPKPVLVRPLTLS